MIGVCRKPSPTMFPEGTRPLIRDLLQLSLRVPHVQGAVTGAGGALEGVGVHGGWVDVGWGSYMGVTSGTGQLNML